MECVIETKRISSKYFEMTQSITQKGTTRCEVTFQRLYMD